MKAIIKEEATQGQSADGEAKRACLSPEDLPNLQAEEETLATEIGEDQLLGQEENQEIVFWEAGGRLIVSHATKIVKGWSSGW